MEFSGPETWMQNLKELVRTCNTCQRSSTEEKAQAKIFEILKTPVHRSHPKIEEVLEVFENFAEKAKILAEKYPRVLSELLVLFLASSAHQSPQLLRFANEGAEALGREAALEKKSERKAALLIEQMKILTSIPDMEIFREIEKTVAEEIKKHLGIDWAFTGKEARLYPGQAEPVPVVFCEILSRPAVAPEEDLLQQLEEQIEKTDGYFLFPKEENRKIFYLTPKEIEFLNLCSKHLLLSSRDQLPYASALLRAALSAQHDPLSLLLFSQTLVDRPLVSLSVIEHVSLPESSYERTYDLMRAKSLSSVGSHREALSLFEKHGEIEDAIVSMRLSGQTSQASLLLQRKIEEARKKLEVEQLSTDFVSLFAGSKPSSALTAARTDLASLLYTLGHIENSTEILKEAFMLLKTSKYAKSLCTRLLLEGKAEEARSVLQECSFEILDVDMALILSGSLVQKRKFQDAEKILRRSRVFNRKDERIEAALHIVLLQQDKIEDLFEILAEKANRPSTDPLKDSNTLFRYACSFGKYAHCYEVIINTYKRINTVPSDWLDRLLREAEHRKEAKEELLRALSEINSLATSQYIKKAMEISHEIDPAVEYASRKRLLEDALDKKDKKEAEKQLHHMEALSKTAKTTEDYLDAFYTFHQVFR